MQTWLMMLAITAAPEPTFNRDVAPIVFQHCAACHRPGEVAPFSLLNYRDVQKRGGLIERVVDKRFMPPWKVVQGHGDFRDVRRLADAEIDVIHRWVKAGMPEGDPKDLPAEPKFTAGWQMGKPDMVIVMPEPYNVPAEGPDIYRNFVIPLKLPPGKYIKAVEHRPNNRRVVHHAALSIDSAGLGRKLDADDPGPGFTRFTPPGQLFPGSLAAWTPGRESRPLPDGLSLAWPQGADLILQLHLHPSGKPEVEQSTVGLYLTDQAPRRSMLDVVLIDKKIDIPPGEKAYRSGDRYTLPVDCTALAVYPHMHMLGKDVKVTAVLPDGTKQSILWIDDWDFKWQNFYEYQKPLRLPKGTQLTMECVHDNSATNPNNPTTPPKRVRWGEATFDEMSAAILQLQPDRESDVAAMIQTLGPRIVGRILASNPEANKALEDAVAKQVEELIRRFDKDGDGKLSLEEIKAIPGAKDVAAILARFDKDGDQKLDAAELTEAIKALTGR